MLLSKCLLIACKAHYDNAYLGIFLISVEVDCSTLEGISSNDKVCYSGNDTNSQIEVCDKQCLGGCFGETQENCSACRNVFWNVSGGMCTNECPRGLLLVSPVSQVVLVALCQRRALRTCDISCIETLFLCYSTKIGSALLKAAVVILK